MKAKRKLPRVFSVGCAEMTPAELTTLVEQLKVVVIDVRSRPSGRAKRGFSRTNLAALLGGKYEYRGLELGEAGAGPTIEGLKALVKDRRRLLLLGHSTSPGECDRHSGIAVPLAVAGVTVWHIYESQVVEAAELQRAIDEETEYEHTELADVIANAK